MLRFTIRDVLWLTVVVAVCVMWQAERGRAVRLDEAQQRLTEKLTRTEVNLEKAETQIADYEAEKLAARRWEASRRDPQNLVYFPDRDDSRTKSGADAAKEAIRRIENIFVP